MSALAEMPAQRTAVLIKSGLFGSAAGELRRWDKEFGVKFVLLLSLGVLAIATNAALSPTVQAESRTPAEATAHALDELANVCAQRRPECPPTLTAMPTWTASPTSTSTPQPTDTATPGPTSTPTVTPEQPCWLTDPDLGDPDSGYIVFDQAGAPVPCPVVQVDEPTPEPTPTPTTTPTATSRPPSQPVAAQQVQVVVQTVVVLVTAVPTDTSLPTSTAAPTPTRATTVTPRPTLTATATGTPTTVTSAYRPTPAAGESTSPGPPPSVNWSLLGTLLGSAVVLLVAVVIGVAIKRRTIVRKPRPPRGETYA
jgi:hypothetical protein